MSPVEFNTFIFCMFISLGISSVGGIYVYYIFKALEAVE